MSVMILLDKPIPEQGDVNITLNQSFRITIGAEEARQKVHNWLVDKVSCSIGAKVPIQVVDHRPVWRVPAWMGVPRVGTEHTLGTIDVDVETGELYNLSLARAEIESQATNLSKKMSNSTLYQAVSTIDDYLESSILPAPLLELSDDEYEPSFAIDGASSLPHHLRKDPQIV